MLSIIICLLQLLSHFVFADAIVLVSKSPEEMDSMLSVIHHVSKTVTLSMNLSKTKVMLKYGSETWAPKKAHMELLSVAQRKLERHIAGHHPTRPQT